MSPNWFDVKNLLVIKPSSLGDIVHALQWACSLRQQIPDVRLTWVVRDLFAPIVEASGLVERVIVFERKKGVSGWWQVMRQIREQRFDVALDMQGLARSALWTRAAKADRKIGRADGRELANWLIREKVSLPEQGTEAHALEILLQYLKLWDLPAELSGNLQFAGLPKPDLAAEGTTWLVFPESRRAEKEWPYLMEACQAWLERYPQLNLVALAGRDREVPQALRNHTRWKNLMGKTGLTEMIAWIQYADGVIVNDSGPMHIAAALNKPLLALFGATPAKRFGPYPLSNPRFQVLNSSTDSMSGLSCQDVVEAADSSFSQSLGRR